MEVAFLFRLEDQLQDSALDEMNYKTKQSQVIFAHQLPTSNHQLTSLRLYLCQYRRASYVTPIKKFTFAAELRSS